MSEKDLVFLSPDEIPKLRIGNIGRKWSKIFEQIPEGKVLVMETKEYGSAPNIRSQVKKFNEEKGQDILSVTQRTDKETEKTTVYVMRNI